MRLFALAASFVILLTSLTGVAQANVPGDLSFMVLRNGHKIGTKQYTFQGDAKKMTVDIVTDIKVKIAFITAYRFEHEAREEWVDGKLVGTTSVTNDDGDKHKLKVEADGGVLNVDGNGKQSQVGLGAVPASLWHPDTVKSNTLLNTMHGKMMAIQAEDLGEEEVKIQKGKMTPARHYRITGELERELWFDANGTLVQVRFKGEDGSKIEYVLR